MSPFASFGLAEPLLRALATEGYEQPTPIQTKAIPEVLAGHDLCGIAQTGTGKTAAFALPILHYLNATPVPRTRKGCRVLVLAPTRELASQIADSFRAYGRHLTLSTTVVFGGVPLGRQERTMAPGVDVLVATPGRLIDLIDRGALTLRAVEVLVLDEADQMLDLGFIHALKRIVKMLPAKRQTLLFSATMPKAIAGLAAEFLTKPVQVAVAPVATTVERVEQRVIFVNTAQKQPLLQHVLSDPALSRALVFTRTKHGADKVVRHLVQAGIEAAAIHGNKSQSQRERALAGFRAGDCKILIATDIAARGIDVEAVSHVVNFDLPNVPESYVHRIGRTARAGAAGIAISFCNGEERPFLRDIETLTRQKLTVAALPAGLPASAPPLAVDRDRDHDRGQSQGRRGANRPNEGRSAPAGQHRRTQKPYGQPGMGARSGERRTDFSRLAASIQPPR